MSTDLCAGSMDLFDDDAVDISVSDAPEVTPKIDPAPVSPSNVQTTAKPPVDSSIM